MTQQISRASEGVAVAREELRRAPETFRKIKEQWLDIAGKTRKEPEKKNLGWRKGGRLAYISHRVHEFAKREEEAREFDKRK